uniref:Uncharacterized protein n=1 Tax=Rhodosorus marinus TaxID=101924 RepID=A0A7S2ZXR8_9RHOD|mmetsp:Transcript_36652/g.146508  ORF Transcript_36652/g.146508 Transcript_36652/m.146508 type:complete len:172 (+) Transcript_36652:126-641(+)
MLEGRGKALVSRFGDQEGFVLFSYPFFFFKSLWIPLVVIDLFWGFGRGSGELGKGFELLFLCRSPVRVFFFGNQSLSLLRKEQANMSSFFSNLNDKMRKASQDIGPKAAQFQKQMNNKWAEVYGANEAGQLYIEDEELVSLIEAHSPTIDWTFLARLFICAEECWLLALIV